MIEYQLDRKSKKKPAQSASSIPKQPSDRSTIGFKACSLKLLLCGYEGLRLHPFAVPVDETSLARYHYGEPVVNLLTAAEVVARWFWFVIAAWLLRSPILDSSATFQNAIAGYISWSLILTFVQRNYGLNNRSLNSCFSAYLAFLIFLIISRH